MTLSSRLASPTSGRTPVKSAVDVWADSLPETDREAVYQAARNPDWGHVALRDALHAEGAPFMSDTAFRGWRKKHGWSA